MPKKRKNRGRHKGDKGKESVVYCDNCGRRVPRSKAVRVTVPYSPPVPGDLAKDLEKQGALITRYYVTKTYCVNCAIYMGGILKVRSETERKVERKPSPKVQQCLGPRPSLKAPSNPMHRNLEFRSSKP